MRHADDQRELRRSPAAALIAIAVMLLPVAYLLSAGPADWLYQHGLLSRSALVIYAPLEYLYDHCEPIQAPLDWYMKLWR